MIITHTIITYVGAPISVGDDELRYGRTGTITDWNEKQIAFVPDGTKTVFWVKNRYIYQPEIDKTRYCPCP